MTDPYSFKIENKSGSEISNVEILNAFKNYDKKQLYVTYEIPTMDHNRFLQSMIFFNEDKSYCESSGFKVNKIIIEYFQNGIRNLNLKPSLIKYCHYSIVEAGLIEESTIINTKGLVTEKTSKFYAKWKNCYECYPRPFIMDGNFIIDRDLDINFLSKFIVLSVPAHTEMYIHMFPKIKTI